MAKAKKVYRVEHPSDGYGIYCAGKGNCIYECPEFDSNNKRHPMPHDDSKLIKAMNGQNFKDNLFYGFSSMRQLKMWIFDNKVLQWLDAKGFKLLIYSCPESYHGNTQAVFVRSTATLVGTKSLLELID